ncbi:class I SAM-dependent methyltransferase [Candidatus Shapirobacteria bacterium]|nr:class I SAM-dependent methyltransferase [Candidatus Shapirobacteria bacterium]
MATQKKQRKCLVCESDNTRQWKIDSSFVECLQCRSVSMSGVVKSVYDKEYYGRSKSGWLMNIVDKFAFWDRYQTLSLSKNDKVLEIGFGEGKFLKALKSMGYRVFGVEKSKYARRQIENVLGKDHLFDDIDKVKEKFELVVMYHVLEHIEKPAEYIRKILGILSPTGRLVVRVPNVESWEAKLAGANWYHLDYPNHQTLFSEAGLLKMFEDVGFKDIKSRNYFGEYRQVMGYSILSKFGFKLTIPTMIVFQTITIPILWIFSVLVAQHGVVEVEGKSGKI